jgi:hypothetical protein
MDADILQAIQIIDAKITSLQEARNRLANAFGIATTSAAPVRLGNLAERQSTGAPRLDQASNGHAPPQSQPSGRKVELAQFLSEHGQMSRVAIVEKSGIPEGTVSYCLSDKRFFEQTESGDWTITDFSRKGLERRTKTGSFHAEDR